MRASSVAPPLVALAALVAACSGEPTSPCPPDEAYFEARVWRPVLADRCAICHNPGGLARGSALVLTAPGEDAGVDMGSNLERARRMALATEDGEPLLLRRPTGTGHPGGRVIAPGSPEHRALVEFVARVRGEAGACDGALACQAGDPGPRLLRRLSRDEYDNTLAALFGIETRYAPALVADVVVHGFDNNARALAVTPLLAEQLRQAAEEVAATVAARPELACAGDGATCARTWLEGPGARVVRRPLVAGELERWLEVYRTGRELAASGVAPHRAGMELVLAAMLQSPTFLYRSELGEPTGDGRFALTSFEIASELSYFLWAGPPDDALWAAALADELRDPDQIERHTRRMLASPRARASLDRFTAQWLGVDQLEHVARDPALYAALTPSVRAAMGEEVRRQVAAAAQGGATLADLLAGASTHVDAELAAYYGLPAPPAVDGAGFGVVDAPGRAGLLATGAVLTTHARASSSSPIHRGKLVRERLLCQPLPPPPPGINAEPPAHDPSLTTRERYRQHAEDAACSGCHRLIDPIGFAFEHFDGIGRWRADEGGLAIDATGEIVASAGSDGAFDGLGELGAHLATSPGVAGCFSTQWARWAYGLDDDVQLGCLVEEIEAGFAARGHVVEDLIVALTRTSHVRFRRDAGGGGDGDGGGGGDGGGDGAGSGGGSGSGSGGGSGSGSGGSDPGDTPGVTAAVVVDDRWATGYCARVVVTNTTAAPVVWRVTVTVEGTISSHWNGVFTQSGARVTVTGAAFNATLPAAGTAEAGFCAEL